MKHRSKFLVIVDDSEELSTAIRFAAKRALNTKGGIVLLNIIEYTDPQQWQSVEDIIIQEARDDAEKKLQKWSKIVHDMSGITPEILIKEGITSEKILEFLEEDNQIRFLVLAAAEGEEPGPLVSLLAGKKSGILPVPVVVIPSAITNDSIDDLASRAD
tara:strand:- start:756 stop:1232 length:477 start_codon:yes stop_codon:yes gene_type:complete